MLFGCDLKALYKLNRKEHLIYVNFVFKFIFIDSISNVKLAQW